ncbi:MAG: hypothetical protein ABSA71_10550, partial [Desulfomonilia bacterium]
MDTNTLLAQEVQSFLGMSRAKNAQSSIIAVKAVAWLIYIERGRVDQGSYLPRPLYRSGRADFPHPAPQETDSLLAESTMHND